MKKRTAKTISIIGLIEKFPNQKTAINYLESIIWCKRIFCGRCGNSNYSIKSTGKKFCNICRRDFNIKTNTIMQGSKVPVHKWFYAIYLFVTARKGISSLQLSKELDLTQKTAWTLGQKIRESCKMDNSLLEGIVEIDETYIGGIEKNKHSNKRKRGSQGGSNKSIVIGMRERLTGKTKAKVIDDVTSKTLEKTLKANVNENSLLCTDELKGYKKVDFARLEVKHSAKEYVNGLASTNSIESVWALLKRGHKGVYHNFSIKHLQRYINEFIFRLNEANCQIDTMDRINSFLFNIKGKKIIYNEITHE